VVVSGVILGYGRTVRLLLSAGQVVEELGKLQLPSGGSW